MLEVWQCPWCDWFARDPWGKLDWSEVGSHLKTWHGHIDIASKVLGWNIATVPTKQGVYRFSG